MGERVFECVFWGRIFNSSPIPTRAMIRVTRKDRTQRVQLHVGLRVGSPGEFTCTQILHLGALLDGPKGLVTHFLGPDFSDVSDDG